VVHSGEDWLEEEVSEPFNEREISSMKNQVGDLYSEIRRIDTENRGRDKELMRAEVVREYEEKHKEEMKVDADQRDREIRDQREKMIKYVAYAVAAFFIAETMGLFEGMV